MRLSRHAVVLCISVSVLVLAVAACSSCGHEKHAKDRPARSSVEALNVATEALAQRGDSLPTGPAAEPPGNAKVHFIDVTDGDATLIEFPCGAMLIDAGGQPTKLFPYLDQFFARRPDLNYTLQLVVLTHSHDDHVSNFIALAKAYKVRRVIHNGRGEASQRAVLKWLRKHPEIVQFAVSAEVIPRGGITSDVIDPFACESVDPRIRVLWGAVPVQPPKWSKKAYDDKNNHSVTLRIDYGKESMLFTGDLEHAGIGELVAKQGKTVLDVDLFKIGHHGYESGSTPALLEAVSPEVAVLSRPADRPLFVKDLALFERTVRKARPAMDVRVWDYEPGVDPRAVGRFDPNGQPAEWGVSRGVMRPSKLRRAIYWTGREGTIVIDVNADGGVTLEQPVTPAVAEPPAASEAPAQPPVGVEATP